MKAEPIDGAKLIMALEHCLSHNPSCEECPYSSGNNLPEGRTCVDDTQRNALELLKDYRRYLTQMRDGLETIIDLTIDYDGEITSEGLMKLIDQIRYVAKQNLQETGGEDLGAD